MSLYRLGFPENPLNTGYVNRLRPQDYEAQIAYHPIDVIAVSNRWNVQRRVLIALRDHMPDHISAKDYLTPVALAAGVHFQTLYRWITGDTNNPGVWCVQAVAQYLEAVHGPQIWEQTK